MAIVLTSLKFIGAAIFALAGSGVTYQYLGTKLDEHKYQPIGRMVDIGGYNLHMVDLGTGGPTVVIDAGVGCNCLDWALVQPEIAKFARVITYDRGGYGWSDVSPLSRSSENIVEELRTMLRIADVPGPYILIGHSFGGHNMMLYAAKYPDEVVGLVLVDAAHEDLLKSVQLPATEYFQAMMGAVNLGFFRMLTNLSWVREIMDQHVEKFPIDIRDVYFSQRITSKFINSLAAEAFYAQESCSQLQKAGKYFGTMPLTVITAGQPLMAYDEPRVRGVYTQEQVDGINKEWFRLQADLVTKSSYAQHIIAENSGHMIALDEPEIIVMAVRKMVDELQNMQN